MSRLELLQDVINLNMKFHRRSERSFTPSQIFQSAEMKNDGTGVTVSFATERVVGSDSYPHFIKISSDLYTTSGHFRRSIEFRAKLTDIDREEFMKYKCLRKPAEFYEDTRKEKQLFDALWETCDL